MPDSSNNESTLVDCAIAGDVDAFGELYQLHLDAIYRYVYFRVEDVNDAEDLTEQVFLKAWEALPGYQHRGHPFTSWLYRIAHNVVVDHHRRRKLFEPMPSVERVNLKSRQSTSEQVIKAEETAALAEAIAQLPEVEQQVIVLRFIEGLKHAEIARILDKSNGACRTIQYRALATLNQLLTGVREGM